MGKKTFIIDCPWCKAKVAAKETGRAEKSGYIDIADEPFAHKVLVGRCPSCSSILVGKAEQTAFKGYDYHKDIWTDVTRLYPKPAKTFSSLRIPQVVKDSLDEADRSLQAGANIAACAMLGRALEALCRDVLEDTSETEELTAKTKKKIMLGAGIKQLKDNNIIDDRLYDWSQQLRAFRNLAAHPEDLRISRNDAEDLQVFVNAIIEYVYDLTDLYDEFTKRHLALK